MSELKTWNIKIEELNEQLNYLEKESWDVVSIIPDVYEPMEDYKESIELKSVYVIVKKN